jgi:hypothetical protein
MQGMQQSPASARFDNSYNGFSSNGFGFNNGFAPMTVINPLQSMGALSSNKYLRPPYQ